MRVPWIISVVFVVSIAALSIGCGSESCDAAKTKLEACLKQLDCRDVDPMQRNKCTTAKSNGEKALTALDAPCVAQVSDTAAQINRCPTLVPASFCNPCVSF